MSQSKPGLPFSIFSLPTRRKALLLAIPSLGLGLAACSGSASGPIQASQSSVSSGSAVDANDVISDANLTGAQGVTASDVEAFLHAKGSALAGYVDPISGQTAAALIVSLSEASQISPVYMLARIETESSLVTSGSLGNLDSATGCGCPDTAACDPAHSGFYNQIGCAASTVRGYLTELASGDATVSGWKVGVAKDTLDPCAITPANMATAAMYTYTPWVGQYSTSSCGRAGIGGTSLMAVLFQEYLAAFPGSSSGGGTTCTGSGGDRIAAIALANANEQACSTNSAGGKGFASSCTGNAGRPEYWCADFARWAWGQAGVADVDQLTAGAASFYAYGASHHTLSNTPAVGDAVVFDYSAGFAEHVAIVTSVNSDGTIETISGDWNGSYGSCGNPESTACEAVFSSSSHVVINTPAYAGVVGKVPGPMGMTLSTFVAPVGASSCGGQPPPPPPSFVTVVSTPDGMGYWEAKGNGTVVAHGTAGAYGSITTPLNAPIVGMATTPDGKGYWLAAADGGVFTFGDAHFKGSLGTTHLNAPVVGMASTPDGLGYWLVGADGGIFTFGDAPFKGSLGGTKLNAPVVGMAATPDGLGYWLTAADGGVFTFGDAPFKGSMGGTKLNAPVVGIAGTPDGLGYWLTAADGGVFTFGDAAFHGSLGSKTPSAPITSIASDRGGYWLMAGDGTIYSFGNAPTPGKGPYVALASTPDGKGYWEAGADGSVYSFGSAGWYGSLAGTHLNAPIVGIASTPDGKGYWLTGSDGGIFTYGTAVFKGSLAGDKLNAPVVGIAATKDGNGYWLTAADGGIFTFGDAAFKGSLGGMKLNAPIVAIARTPDGLGYWLTGADGGIFTFGDAAFKGSLGGTKLSAPIVGIAATHDGLGYWLTASDGGVFTFGDAAFGGSAASIPHAPVKAIASDGSSGYWVLADDGAIFSFGGAGYHGGAN
jgi:CHAP domain